MVLPEISSEMDMVIKSSLRSGDETTLTTNILGKDIKRLIEPRWLNDVLINEYIRLLETRGGSEKFPKVFGFNTHFYTSFRDFGYENISRFIRKCNIFNYEILLIPIHLGNHWCLAVIDLKQKIFSYYDSLAAGSNNQCIKLLFTYLKYEHNRRLGRIMNMRGWVTRIEKDIPQQGNRYDCGMFLCKFAEFTCRRAKISFQQSDMTYYRRRMVYELVKSQLMYP